MNKVLLIGRLGQDPRVTTLPSGTMVAEFSVATSEQWKDRETGEKKEQTEWHNVKVFGPAANFCGNYLNKGGLVFVEGKVTYRKWQAQDGSDRYRTEIVVSGPGAKIEKLDWQKGGGQPAGGHDDPSPSQGPAFPSEASGIDDVPF